MSLDKVNDDSVVAITGKRWNELVKTLNEWTNLIADPLGPLRLVRGELQSILSFDMSRLPKDDGGAHPLKVVDASDADGPKVRIIPGVVSFAVMPTADGATPISSVPPPTIATPSSGFIILATNWSNDSVPRSVPLTASFEFEPGDPDAAIYVPSPPDSLTGARMCHARVWVSDGRITRILTGPSGNILVVRENFGDYSINFIAVKA